MAEVKPPDVTFTYGITGLTDNSVTVLYYITETDHNDGWELTIFPKVGTDIKGQVSTPYYKLLNDTVSGLDEGTGYTTYLKGFKSAGFTTYGARANEIPSDGFSTSSTTADASITVKSSLNKFGGLYKVEYPMDGDSRYPALKNKSLNGYGFVCGEATTPIIGGNNVIKTEVGTDINGFSCIEAEDFSATIPKLSGSTLYYVRSYAIWYKDSSKTWVTVYGPERQITTPKLLEATNNSSNNSTTATGTLAVVPVKVPTSDKPSYTPEEPILDHWWESPRSGTLSGSVDLLGWAASTLGMESINVFVDNVYVGYASEDMSRRITWGEDVFRSFSFEDLPKYKYVLDTKLYSNGSHTVKIIATQILYNGSNEKNIQESILTFDNESKPSTPGLTATGTTEKKINLSWTTWPTNCQKLEVERYRFAWGKIATLSNNETTYVDMDVDDGVAYTYRVRGLNYTLYGDYSNESTATAYVKKIPSVITTTITDTTYSSTKVSGALSSENHSAVTERGICYSTNPTPTISGSKVIGGTSTDFTCTINNLTRNATYYVRAYAINAIGVGYGDIRSTTTLTQLPTVNVSVTDILAHTCKFNGLVTDDGANTISEVGFYYSGTPDSVNTGTKIVSNIDTTYKFNKPMTGVSHNKIYYIVSYVKCTNGMSNFSNEITFTTLDFVKMPTPEAPVAIDRTHNSMKWVCGTIGARIVITGYPGTFTSPTNLTSLVSDTVYSAYAYIPGDGILTDDSIHTDLVYARTRKITPTKPSVAEIEQDYIIWVTPTQGAKIVCDTKTKTSGETWFNLTPDTEYEAYSYQPGTVGWDNDSFPSEIVKIRTPKLKYGRPSNILVEYLSARSVKLSAAVGTPPGNVVIVCNGQTKPSGSIWSWLTPSTEYTAVAFVPADIDHRKSDEVQTSFTTLEFGLWEPDLYVIGFMEDGARASTKILNNMTITSSNPDIVDIVDKKILTILPGNTRITITCEGCQTYSDITIV